jgi:hypothetical protein
MNSKPWTAGTNTRDNNGPTFKTKREAIEYARRTFSGIFFVWKKKPTK